MMKKGEEGLQNSFPWSCISRDNFNAYDLMKNNCYKEYKLEKHCLTLSDN